jgi:hypothetical protein
MSNYVGGKSRTPLGILNLASVAAMLGADSLIIDGSTPHAGRRERSPEESASRQSKAEQKRARKAAKRIAVLGGRVM